jgi:hypothetical protein
MQDRITLRSIKHSEFASEETNCFEAVVCFDGKPVCAVSNDGRGGCDMHHPLKGKNWEQMREAMAPMEAYIKTLPRSAPDEHFPEGLEETLETVVGDLLTRHLHRKDLTRLLSKAVVFVDVDGKMYTSKPKKPHPVSALVELFGRKYPERKLLNTMPLDEALTVYLEKGATQ